MSEIKYEVKLAMMRIGNFWCQKSQLTDISCDYLLIIYLFKILNYTQSLVHIIPLFVNTWSDHWRSYDNK